MNEAKTPDDDGHVDSIHWPSLAAAISAITAVGIAIGLGLPLLSIILEKRGISSTLIGLNSAMAGDRGHGCGAYHHQARPSTGAWRPTMLWAVVIASGEFGIGFYYAEQFWILVSACASFFHGATTTLFILSEFWINAAAPPKRRGLVLGIYATVLSVGFAVGAPALLPDSAATAFCRSPIAVLCAILCRCDPYLSSRGAKARHLDEKAPAHHFPALHLPRTHGDSRRVHLRCRRGRGDCRSFRSMRPANRLRRNRRLRCC